MKKIIATLALILAAGTAQANECLDNIDAYAKDDKMLVAWGIENDTQDTIVFVQNIRNLKPVDIEFYGFNKDMATTMENMFGCKNVKFEDAYTKLGLPRYNLAK
jgi:hypothetical protein